MKQSTQPTFDNKAWELLTKLAPQLSKNIEQRNPNIYVLSNEVWSPEIYTALRGEKAKPNAGHMGVSSLQNLDVAAARRSGFVIFINNLPAMQQVVDLLITPLKCPNMDRRQYCKDLYQLVSTQVSEDILLDNRDTLKEDLESELVREGSFLSNDNSFEYITGLARQGRLLNLQIDLTDWSSFHRLLGFMIGTKFSVDTFYLSNVMMHAKHLADSPFAPKALMASLGGLASEFPNALMIESDCVDLKPLKVQMPLLIGDYIKAN